MLPVRLSDVIAKPLVGDLMRHQGFYSRGADGVLEVEYGAGIFQSAESCLGLYIGQFLKRVRSYFPDIEGEYFGGDCVTLKSLHFILGKNIAVIGNIPYIPGMVDGKVRDPDDHYLGG